MNYDVIIAGAGPAGSMASYYLSSLGYKVLLLEKEKLPRYKTCGGCLSSRIKNLFPFSIENCLDGVVSKVTFSYSGNDRIDYKSECPLVYMVMRDKFDAFLTEKSVIAGTELRVGEKVEAVIEFNNEIEIHTGRNKYKGKFLIGADGVKSKVAALAGLNRKKLLGAGCVTECLVYSNTGGPGDGGSFRYDGENRDDRGALISFGVVPSGYGWAFPKKDHWTLGVAGYKGNLKNIKEIYRRFVKTENFNLKELKRRGNLVPAFNNRSDIATDRIFLVGDAASLVDPFLGEGIIYAVKSAEIAARLIDKKMKNRAANLKQGYISAVKREIFSELQSARTIAAYFYLFQRIAYKKIKGNPVFLKIFFNMLTGAGTYRNFLNIIRKRVKFPVPESVFQFYFYSLQLGLSTRSPTIFSSRSDKV